jgi:hypothetical protein
MARILAESIDLSRQAQLAAVSLKATAAQPAKKSRGSRSSPRRCITVVEGW